MALGSLERVVEIADGLRGVTFGKTLVENVELDVTEDANGDRALFVDVILKDPSGDTWPPEDILTIRRKVLEIARQIPPIEIAIYISMSPKTDAPQEGDKPTLFGDF